MSNNDGSDVKIMCKRLNCCSNSRTTLIVAGDGAVYICDGNLQIIWPGQLHPFV